MDLTIEELFALLGKTVVEVAIQQKEIAQLRDANTTLQIALTAAQTKEPE